MSQLDDILALQRQVSDQIMQQQTQLLAIQELLVILAEAELKTNTQARIGQPRIMPVGDGLIIRQPYDKRGYLVSHTDANGTIRDQAFQDNAGDWWTVGLSEDQELTTVERRDAIRVGA